MAEKPNPQRIALAVMIDQAREHQEMNRQYEAYRRLVSWLDQKIQTLDATWHLKSVDRDALNQLRGQKTILVEFRDNLRGDLTMDIEAETQKMLAMPETVDAESNEE